MRGDVYEMTAPRRARGNEQRGRRFGVVVQTDRLDLSTWLVSPTSRSAGPTTFRPEIELGDEITRVLVEQTTAMSPERLGRMVGRVTHRELAEIESALRVVLDLDRPPGVPFMRQG